MISILLPSSLRNKLLNTAETKMSSRSITAFVLKLQWGDLEKTSGLSIRYVGKADDFKDQRKQRTKRENAPCEDWQYTLWWTHPLFKVIFIQFMVDCYTMRSDTANQFWYDCIFIATVTFLLKMSPESAIHFYQHWLPNPSLPTLLRLLFNRGPPWRKSGSSQVGQMTAVM